jgi:hypothetical protein
MLFLANNIMEGQYGSVEDGFANEEYISKESDYFGDCTILAMKQFLKFAKERHKEEVE